MCHLSDQPPCRADRQTRVCIQCDDVADASRQCGHIAVDWHESRIGGAAQQAIQLMQLAALALPADPFSFACIPETSPMKKEKTRMLPSALG